MTFHQLDENYSFFELKSCDNHYKSLVDTRFVDDLKQFQWKIPRSRDPNRKGMYFMAPVLAKHRYLYNSILKKDHLVFMHELIAFLNCTERPATDERLTVDHIDRETLDNRSENLRWATILQQNRNRNKKENRTKPPDYIPDPLPMYVTWNSGYEKSASTGKDILREFFRIEKHPALPVNANNNTKIWSSSKHREVSIQEKYTQTLNKLAQLDLAEPPDTSIDELRVKNLESYRRIMNIQVPEQKHTEVPEVKELNRESLLFELNNDYLVLKHTDGTIAITNKRFFKDLKTFSIHPENGTFKVTVLPKHKKLYSIPSSSKTLLHNIIMHLDGQFCQNDNKSLRFVCHRNGLAGDCRIENLYWGSKTQQQMCKEKKPITNLPKDCGVSVEDIPKYVYYHAEPKEYWFITHHPGLEDLGKSKIISSTSKNISTLDKFKEIIGKLEELNSQSNFTIDTPEFIKQLLC